MIKISALAVAISLILSDMAAACGPNSDCNLGTRTYRLDMPVTSNAPGAIIFAHGYRGSASRTMRNRGLRALARDLGVALVAVKSYALDWRIPGGPADPGTDGSIELAYFDALIRDLALKGIDTDRLLVAGFSAGGMMVWELACHRPDRFAGFAPIAGTFWAPVPRACSGQAVNMFHTHGLSDRIVPLEGRTIGASRQGAVPDALDLLRKEGAYGPSRRFAARGLACTGQGTSNGHVLEFCTHPGGHAFKTEYLRRAWNRLTEIGAL